ncbi:MULTISPECIES: hypothetical protein [unclassified Bradyrhizobium]|uniref:hypothetical protein n=1 Tax=unclassified Bradyrhizobium TaxID=2631580 RepID=UPI001FF8EBF6|nr:MULTISPECIES: hypothetical protein [unclassified Bradyrhizobium]MCK1298475.1 hypothetical protein [Bradyrhizobium sp. 37]MCK1769519.1 hypothetical protein [Bradyrhizobium sp. 134]
MLLLCLPSVRRGEASGAAAARRAGPPAMGRYASPAWRRRRAQPAPHDGLDLFVGQMALLPEPTGHRENAGAGFAGRRTSPA